MLALALILIATARRRRRDLALLKALGFTQRQLASVVAWHSTVAALFGTVFGILMGIVVRRQLWTLFTQRQHRARPDGSVLVRSPYGTRRLAVRQSGRRRNEARTPSTLVSRAE